VHVDQAALTLLAAKSNSGNGLGTVVLFGLIVVGGYLLFVRPQRARQRKALEERKRALEPGIEVVTTAGLIATVVTTDDETVTLEIAPGVHSRFLRQAIVKVVEPDVPEPEPPTLEAGDDAPPENHPA